MRARRFAALLVCLAPLAAQAKDFAIGTKGASVQLDAPWRREKLGEDLGNDQFQAVERGGLFARRSEVYVVATEIVAQLENEADFGAAIDDLTSVGNGVPVVVRKEDGWTRATRTFDTTLGGTACVFRCELLVGDGLAYHLMTWSPKSQKKQLDARIDDFLTGFEFPGADSDYRKGLAAKSESVVVGSTTIEFTVRPSVMRTTKPDDDELAQYRSGDDEQLLAVFRTDGYASLPAVVAAENKTLKGWDATWSEAGRGERDIDGVRCAWLHGARNGQAIKSTFVPVGATSYVVFRWLAKGTAEAARPEREAVFGSLRVRKAAAGFTLPVAPEPERKRPDTAMARFLRSGAPMGPPVEMYAISGAQRAGEGWLVWNWQELHEVAASGTRQLLDGAQGIAFAVRWRDLALTGNREGELQAIRDGKRADQLGTALAAAVHGDDLLLLRPAGELLLGVASGSPPVALVRQTPDGSETTLATFACGRVAGLAVDAAGSHVLVHSDDDGVRGLAAEAPSAPRLLLLPLAAPTPRDLGRWRELTAIAAAPEGWLVTGEPEAGAPGVWLVRNDGSREALLAGPGAPRALALDEKALTVLADDGSGNQRIVVLPLEACRRDGVRCHAFSNAQLAALGTAMMAARGGKAPRTADDVLAVRAEAEAQAKRIADQPLPTAPADVVALLESAADWQPPLPAAGRTLLGVLAAAAVLTAGGQWVEGGATDWQAWHLPAPVIEDSPLAQVVQPGQLVRTALDDSEGWATLPIDPEERRGRALLVGVDAAALRTACAQLVPAGLEAALGTGDAAALGTLLSTRAQEGELRRHVYDRLAVRAHHAAIASLAEPFATGAKPTAADVVAWVAATTQLAATPEAARQVFDAGLAAAAKTPREAALYVWLARAAARAFPDDRTRQRACYERALELVQYGPVADAARKALQQLR